MARVQRSCRHHVSTRLVIAAIAAAAVQSLFPHFFISSITLASGTTYMPLSSGFDCTGARRRQCAVCAQGKRIFGKIGASSSTKELKGAIENIASSSLKSLQTSGSSEFDLKETSRVLQDLGVGLSNSLALVKPADSLAKILIVW
eukprot:TRINITY_DN21944_c0_g1_i2.p1 TRINITY_DN21944_c0_g1~~TRINITY_DN21944_c0_g1_i2.p1  ORF type:complete len:145 (-),score=14.47 TRINITY_DN21944_c0_g1_i2:70-504(-)